MPNLDELRAQAESTRALLREHEIALFEAEVADLEAQHSDLVSRCRDAQEQFEGLIAEANDMTEQVRKRENDVRVAQFSLDQHKAEPKPRYPKKNELEERQEAIAAFERALEAANQKARETWADYEQVRLKRNRAQEAFEKLQMEEGMLRARLGAKRGELRNLKPQSAPPIDTSQYDNLVYEFTSSGMVARPGAVATRQYAGNSTVGSTSVAQTMRNYQHAQAMADPLRPI